MADNVYTVSRINRYIRDSFDQDPVLRRISIKGEVSNLKYHSSGHIYFTLKDEKSAIPAVMFAGNRQGLSYRMQSGDSVIATGSISVYERDGKYQLYATQITAAGTGDLYLRFEQLKKKLLEEGLFDDALKRPLPLLPKRVGIVTSATGAAIQDIINVSSRRNPFVQLVLYPARVQGEDAWKTIVKGIEVLNRENADVIIIGRGGGSLEDLFAFNEEAVARAVRASEVPVVSAVGHETDFSISDFAADLRAPTPSAAAELVIPDIRALIQRIEDLYDDLDEGIDMKITELRNRTEYLKLRLSRLAPEARIRDSRVRAMDLENALKNAMERILSDRRHRAAILMERLKGVSPLSRLSAGYAYVTGPDGKTLKEPEKIRSGDELYLRFRTAGIRAVAKDIEESDF
ncbi:MAG: exodeoxyribonuclease VII large subunit [Lachnospiraceae bacterium]|nr:exodeoxyribonuclease VII large subunit [Lachnospiraceae bacterium]